MSSPTTWASTPSAATLGTSTSRLLSIDALRGLVIIFMLLDHVRETFYLHFQVPDPMVVADTPPDLFVSRMLAHLCAPVFIFLTGLSAFLYASKHGGDRVAASTFLWKRGLFLIVLEITVINFAWTFQFPPSTLYLQVIWAIGLSMLALSALVWLPRTLLIGLGLILIVGHNLLDPLQFPPGHGLHVIWSILHDRGWIELTDTMRARTSYPLLPWIGVIALGYAIGPWFLSSASANQRQRSLLGCGLGLLVAFLLVRGLNVYGDKPWIATDSALHTVMSFFNVTKYPPSLLFLALTLGTGLLLLRGLERSQTTRWVAWLAVFGAAPMFFYVLHLYVLKLFYFAAVAVWGTNQGKYFGFDHVWLLWICTPVLAAVLYPAVRAFAAFKARRRDITWLKYL